MLINIVLFIAGIVLGWYGRDWLNQLAAKCGNWFAQRRKKLLREHAEDWLVDYYQNKGRGDDMFALGGAPIPYLTKPSWSNCSNKTIQITIDKTPCPVEISRRTIWARKWLRQRIWDGPTLRLVAVEETDAAFNLKFGPCTYYKYLSRCGKLENELVSCIRTKSWPYPFKTRPKLRDQYADSLDTLLACKLEAQIVGVSVIIAFYKDEKLTVLLQHRSDENAVATGMSAPVPSFVCDPRNMVRLTKDPLFHHFLLEYYEELYNKEDEVNAKRHVDPSWLYQKKPIDELVELYDYGDLVFEVTGFGFDGLTGELHLAAMAFFKSRRAIDFLEREIPLMEKNWEVSETHIDSESFRDLLVSKNNYVTCRFCLSRMEASLKKAGYPV